MLQIRHTDEPIFRCTYEICSRIIRDFGYVCESSLYYSEECCVRDLTEREPRVPCLQ
jgi:hypothetical protein